MQIGGGIRFEPIEKPLLVRVLVEVAVDAAFVDVAFEAVTGTQARPQVVVRVLTEIEQQDYDVFVRRAVVPKRKRLLTAARCFATRPGRPVLVPGRPADPGRTPVAAALAALL